MSACAVHFASRLLQSDQRDLEIAGRAQRVHHLHDVAIGHRAIGAQEDALVACCRRAPSRASTPAPSRGTGSSPSASVRSALTVRKTGLSGRCCGCDGRGRQIDRHVDGRKRRRDHEDDQQHQDHVDERRDVDLVGFREIVAVVSETDRHGATPPRATCAACRTTRSQSRLTSRITSAEPSASSAR